MKVFYNYPFLKFHQDGKVLYVWFDAPIGYISSTIEWAHENKKD